MIYMELFYKVIKINYHISYFIVKRKILTVEEFSLR